MEYTYRKHSTRELVELRKKFVENKLRLLGISKEDDDEKDSDVENMQEKLSFRVLEKVGNSLLSYRNPLLVESDTAEYSTVLDYLVGQVAEDEFFIKEQEEFLERIRSIYPTFGQNMEEKVSSEDFAIYTDAVSRTEEFLRGINGESTNSHTRNLTNLSGVELEDAISDLVDSSSFNIACDIENAFMKSEFAKFIEEAKSLGYEDEDIKHITACLELAMLVREAESLSNERQKSIDKFNTFKAFQKAKSDYITINTQNPINGKKKKMDNPNFGGRDE